MKVGDELLAINGESIVGCTHVEVFHPLILIYLGTYVMNHEVSLGSSSSSAGKVGRLSYCRLKMCCKIRNSRCKCKNRLACLDV